jgi:hypothetical protein
VTNINTAFYSNYMNCDSKQKAGQLSRIIESSIVHSLKKNSPNMRHYGMKGEEDDFSMEKLQEAEEISKARRCGFTFQIKTSFLFSVK